MKEKYKNLGIDKDNLNKWQKRFIREFVNDHGNAWRPLRGLLVEDVLEFIQKEIDSERARTEAYKAVAEKALSRLQKHKKSIDDIAEVERLV